MSGHERLAVTAWELCEAAPGSSVAPDGGWIAATGPCTAASALRAHGSWSLDGAAKRFDASDWWWRARVPLDARAPRGDEEIVLCLDGIATLADVWWNGEHVLGSHDMFVAHQVPVVPHASGSNDLVIRCGSIDLALRAKRPRARRWRVPMVEEQQLRWIRTTLLGRTPGWSPPAAAVGPWREVRVERRRGVVVDAVRVRADVVDGAGVIGVICKVRGASGPVEIVLERDGHGEVHRVGLTGTIGADEHAGRLAVPGAARWWPHTHGLPACYRAHLEIGGARVELGPIGFRTIEIDRGAGGDDFAVVVNGARIFCRGACWTPIDPVALDAPAAAVDAAIAQAADCGMNMLRVGGTMVYESDAFLDACDARGVMVWQDLMFANLEYPDDAAFAETASHEVRQQLERLAAHPSTTIICGGSEVEQQAAMWGASRESWAPPLFHETLRAVATAELTGVPYWPSSAHGGAFPHAPNSGTTSYYGVGAYLRPLDDARRSEVRFASECLAFANIGANVAPGARVHHPSWKARTPRDLGAGWDFDDVRDHYVARLYGVDPAALRYADPDRHVALGQVATGEVMAAAFGEWRRARSVTRGALIWFLRDLWSGAGWGVVDARGAPKPCWYYLKRALAPVAVAITDEGTGGLAIHVVNDRPEPLRGELELAMFRGGEVAVGRATRAIEVPAHGAIELNAVELLEHFTDLSYAYRFGPPTCDLVAATIGDARAFHFPLGLPRARELDVGLALEAEPGAITVRTRRFAQSVCLASETGASFDDNYFHLPPGGARTVRVRGSGKARVTATALNAEATAKIELMP